MKLTKIQHSDRQQNNLKNRLDFYTKLVISKHVANRRSANRKFSAIKQSVNPNGSIGLYTIKSI